MYTYRAKLNRCVDGDTADLEIDLGFYLTAKVRCRLLGVDTPERGKPDYKKATAMLHNLIISETDDEGYFIVHVGKTGKYGRWLVDIRNVNSVLGERWPYDA
jgi:micrococcal nuclease|tara:strand:- start:636 stop:941 length:306 start_codon:yes stop_codon:yes gene_type:complete